jgi:hypothetical protein
VAAGRDTLGGVRRHCRTCQSLIFGMVIAGIVFAIGSCRTTPDEPPLGAAIDLPPDTGWEVRTIDTSIEVELPEPFVRLVDLDRLRIGMTQQEVLAIFPDPYEIGLRGTDDLWQYGFAELIFRNDRLRDWFDVK